ncbi:mCG1048932 [Mus musculus]|nr:mCG1048932 [Mus musculus]
MQNILIHLNHNVMKNCGTHLDRKGDSDILLRKMYFRCSDNSYYHKIAVFLRNRLSH